MMTTSYEYRIIWQKKLARSYESSFNTEIAALHTLLRESLSVSKHQLTGSWYIQYTAAHIRQISYMNCEMFQAERVRDAAFGCEWVGTPIPFQRCLMFIIATANKDFQLTAGKFVPVSNVTTLNVCKSLYNHVS